MKIFLICSIRNADETDKYKQDFYVNGLKRAGYEVYYPLTDTDQTQSGLKICQDNRKAIEESDLVCVLYHLEVQDALVEVLEGAKWLIECYVAKPEGYEEYQDVVKAIRKARLTA